MKSNQKLWTLVSLLILGLVCCWYFCCISPPEDCCEPDGTCDLPAPSNFQFNEIGTDTLTLTWSPVPDASYYTIDLYDITNDPIPLALGITTSDTLLLVNDIISIEPGQVIQANIRAACQNCCISKQFATAETGCIIVIEDIVMMSNDCKLRTCDCPGSSCPRINPIYTGEESYSIHLNNHLELFWISIVCGAETSTFYLQSHWDAIRGERIINIPGLNELSGYCDNGRTNNSPGKCGCGLLDNMHPGYSILFTNDTLTIVLNQLRERDTTWLDCTVEIYRYDHTCDPFVGEEDHQELQ